MTPYLIIAGLVIACIVGWRLIKAGGDANRAKTAEANLAKAKDAAAPVTPAERADVTRLYRRD